MAVIGVHHSGINATVVEIAKQVIYMYNNGLDLPQAKIHPLIEFLGICPAEKSRPTAGWSQNLLIQGRVIGPVYGGSECLARVALRSKSSASPGLVFLEEAPRREQAGSPDGDQAWV